MSEEKFYQLSTFTEEQWDELHIELVNAGNKYQTIPSRSIECVDDKLHSKTRGSYLLTAEEAEILKKDPRVKWINLDYTRYPEIYRPPPREVQATRPELRQRYSSAVKHYREFEVSNTLPANPDSTDVNRTGYQLLRCQQKLEPWIASSSADNAVLTSTISQYGSGKHIDVIVGDDGMWFGHPEFQNNTGTESPADYEGGNVLPGNGTCDLLDLVLDSPYYLDPDWFNSDPVNLLTTRWDGTIVPVESAARNWWLIPAFRSEKFRNIGVVAISSSYTRLDNNGTNQETPYTDLANSVGQHGTPCCALTYGRTQGWAYNSNKWALNVYNILGTDFEPYFDMMKLFHLYKPINPLYGTRDPTISSNSWGYRANKDPAGQTYYYTHRSTSNVSYTAEPLFISHMGVTGDGGRWKGEMKTNSITSALDECIESGVIFVAAAGNSNQKQVNSGHPDFNNYITSTDGGSLQDSAFFEFGLEVYGTTNRRGFPQQGGMYDTDTGERIYPVINIGALDDDFNTGKESKVNYSDRGNSIDVYTPGDGTLCANKDYANEGIYPATYPGFTYNGGVAYDCAFGGTSAACPVAAGFLATVLEHNRDWTWREIKTFLASLDDQDPAVFYTGTESTTPTTSNWQDYESLEGGAAKVLYQGYFDARYKPGQRQLLSRIQITNGFRVRKN